MKRSGVLVLGVPKQFADKRSDCGDDEDDKGAFASLTNGKTSQTQRRKKKKGERERKKGKVALQSLLRWEDVSKSGGYLVVSQYDLCG